MARDGRVWRRLEALGVANDYGLSEVEFSDGVRIHVASADANAGFLGGSPLGDGVAFVWDDASASAFSVSRGAGGSVLGFDYLDTGVLFTVVEGDDLTRVAYLRQGGGVVPSVVSAGPCRFVVQAAVVGGSLVWTESDVSPASGSGPGDVMMAPWSSSGPFPIAGTQVAAVSPITLFVASSTRLDSALPT